MREGSSHIQEKIYRFFTNTDWLSLCLGFRIINLTTSYSNNNCLILNTIGLVESHKRGRKLFRFEAMWVGATRCEEIILSSWQSMEYSDSVKGLRSVVSLCSYHLKQ